MNKKLKTDSQIVRLIQLSMLLTLAFHLQGQTTKKNTSTLDSIKSTYRGIDISHYNGNEAEEITEKDSLTFIICKATQGSTIIDKDFKQNWHTIKSKNMLLGTYHFYVVGQDPIKQADHYYTTVATMGSTDLPLVIDIEQGSIPKGYKVNVSQLQSDLLKFVSVIESKSNRTPMIYTCTGFSNQYLNNKAFAKYPLWLAEYTNAPKPKLPATWIKTGWRIWQKSQNYYINSKPTDYDIYVGSLQELCK